MPWHTVLKTLIVGTERSPLPSPELTRLGLAPAADPAQTALEALAAANLLRKAGLRLLAGRGGEKVAALDARPLCPDAAAQDLEKILSGAYADALPEFLDLLAQNNLRLPPEYLPLVLQKAERNAVLAEKIRSALGPRGEWLARQNPRWSPLLAKESEADWFTATFAERKQLLKNTRSRNPLLALAWLEKTWPEEKPAHRAQFLEMLRVRLSLMDENLLEKAFSDKNKELRRAAIRLSALLPESKKFAEAKTFFAKRLAGAVRLPNRDVFLKKSLPDLSEEAVLPWVALLPTDAKSDWRSGLFSLFVGLLPPAELLSLTGLSREQVLSVLDADPNAAVALVEAVVRHEDGSWAEAVLRHFSRDFRHAVWQSAPMLEFLTIFAPSAMAFLQKNNIALGYENERFLRALENYRRFWPKDLLNNLLEQYRRTAYYQGAEIPGWHYALALQVAAYHCSPAEAAGCTLVRDYLHSPPRARLHEFEVFLSVVRFRQEMRRHLGH